MRVKLVLFTFYSNEGLHAVSIGKPSEQMSNFWMVWFLKTESEPNFGFPHIPIIYFTVVSLVCIHAYAHALLMHIKP